MSDSLTSNKNKITAFQLAMITLAYVASVRVLPTLAEYGFTAIFYYLLGALTFLAPSALVSAELATALPERGGVYVWVKEALGSRWGFLAIWLQFLSNIFALPAYLSFLMATGAYMFAPSLANNKYFLMLGILVIWWIATITSFFGMRTAGWLNTIGSFVATFVPTVAIFILGAMWLIIGHHSQIVFSTKTFFPNFSKLDFNSLAFLAGVLFSLTGMEVSGSHAEDVINTRKNFPKGIFLAVILVVIIGFSSLAIAIVIPQKDLSLIAGSMQAFTVFFDKFNMPWAVTVMSFLMFVGGICVLNSSVIGPSKGLFGAATGGEIPPLLAKINKHHMPVNMFLMQAIGVSIIALFFLFMPSVSSSYWLIMATVTALYLVMYVLLFISGIVLRYKSPHLKRTYKIPGKNIGMWIVASLGILSSLFGITISFFPPSQIMMGSTWMFELFIILGIVLFVGLGLFLYAFRRPEWVVNVDEEFEKEL